MITTICDRIKSLRDHLNLNDSTFARLVGISQPSMKAVCEGANLPSYKTIAGIITACPDVSADWLLLGKGAMLREQNSEHNIYDINYGNQVNGDNNITGNSAPVTVGAAPSHYSTETEEDPYNEVVALRNENRDLRKKLEEERTRSAQLTDKLLKLI